MRAAISIGFASLATAIAWSPGMPVPATSTGADSRRPIVLKTYRPGDQESTGVPTVATGAGHVVASIGLGKQKTALVEVGVGRPVRQIATLATPPMRPSVGTDAAERPVIVAKLCAPSASDPPVPGKACGLASVDLATGAHVPIAGGSDSALGDLDRGRALVVRGRRLTLGRGDTRTTLPPVPQPDGWSSPRVLAVDLHGDAVAATVEYGTESGGASALVRYDGRRWTVLAKSSYGGGAIGPRNFFAPEATAGGALAFFDGAEDEASYAGVWAADGTRLGTVRAGALGNPVHLSSAGFSGGRLYTVPEAWDCADAGCPVQSYGPFPDR